MAPDGTCHIPLVDGAARERSRAEQPRRRARCRLRKTDGDGEHAVGRAAAAGAAVRPARPSPMPHLRGYATCTKSAHTRWVQQVRSLMSTLGTAHGADMYMFLSSSSPPRLLDGHHRPSSGPPPLALVHIVPLWCGWRRGGGGEEEERRAAHVRTWPLSAGRGEPTESSSDSTSNFVCCSV